MSTNIFTPCRIPTRTLSCRLPPSCRQTTTWFGVAQRKRAQGGLHLTGWLWRVHGQKRQADGKCLEGGKKLFRVRLGVVSTVYAGDIYLRKFFQFASCYKNGVLPPGVRPESLEQSTAPPRVPYRSHVALPLPASRPEQRFAACAESPRRANGRS